MLLLDFRVRGDLRDLFRESVRRGPLETRLSEIPHMQPVCSIWKREFDPRVNLMISSDNVPKHINLLDDWANSRNLIGTSEGLIRSCTPFDPISHTTPARVPDGDNIRAGERPMDQHLTGTSGLDCGSLPMASNPVNGSKAWTVISCAYSSVSRLSGVRSLGSSNSEERSKSADWPNLKLNIDIRKMSWASCDISRRIQT